MRKETTVHLITVVSVETIGGPQISHRELIIGCGTPHITKKSS
jgi:hypothetical protein